MRLLHIALEVSRFSFHRVPTQRGSRLPRLLSESRVSSAAHVRFWAKHRALRPGRVATPFPRTPGTTQPIAASPRQQTASGPRALTRAWGSFFLVGWPRRRACRSDEGHSASTGYLLCCDCTVVPGGAFPPHFEAAE